MTCKKCESDKINVQMVVKTSKKGRGICKSLLWLILAMFTCGLILIIPLLTKSKIKSKKQKYAVCQNCGYSWKA